MKLLIITQKVDVDDPILGFFHRWIIEFGKQAEHVSVICLEKGKFKLPPNVEVYSLGKENSKNKLKYIFQFFNLCFFKSLNYDTVFVHMNPVYIVLAGWWWRLMSKRIALWYVHREVDLKLRIAEFFTNKIVTVSKETFNLPSHKLKIVGHGIPLEDFQKPINYKKAEDKFRIVSVGRISPIKNLEVLIEAASYLQDKIPNLEVNIIGSPARKGDDQYLAKLKDLIVHKKLGQIVNFVGEVSNQTIKHYYWGSDISVNLSPTGGVDKAILESMASSLLVLASNRAFADYFGEYKDMLLFKEGDAKDLVNKIIELKKSPDWSKVISFLLNSVKAKAGLTSLISTIIKEMQ